MNKIKIIVISLSIICVSHVSASDKKTIRHYSKSGSRTGYSVIENGRESKFDANWNREGYSVHSETKTEHFDSGWNRQGRDEFKDDELQLEKGGN